MSNICIISCDKLFARMLELELISKPLTVKTVTEKLNIPALKIAVENAELVILDADYFGGDLTFVKKIALPFVVFSKKQLSELPENVKAFFERPFVTSDFVNTVLSLYQTDESPTGTDNIKSIPQTSAEGYSYTLELDRFLKQATVNGQVIKFTPKEFALLSLLYTNRGKVVPREKVINTLWGASYDTSNNVDNVYINYLRKKLDLQFGIKMIYTVRGKGYMMK